jgi:hypothetical protein
MRIQYATGLSMSDLPDRNEFWDIVEEIEAELNEEDFSMQKIKESLREITPELIEQLCW